MAAENVMQTWRGHEIVQGRDGQFYYADTKDPVYRNERPCGHCGLANTPEGHDGCLGTLPGVQNACCGHGNIEAAYVHFDSGEAIYSHAALDWIANATRDAQNVAAVSPR